MTTEHRERACKDGHAFVVRAIDGHDEWYCVVCFFVPGARDLLAAYVEKHRGKIL